jgi:hypothetical protein
MVQRVSGHVGDAHTGLAMQSREEMISVVALVFAHNVTSKLLVAAQPLDLS